MKHAKKLASLLLALAMLLGLATTALAVGNDGSITISNATVGEKYAVYKVFDLTYSGNAVSYSYTKNGDNDALFNALNGNDSPFTLTATSTTNVYSVSLKEGKTAADVSAFLKANEANLTKTAGPVTAATNEVKFEDLPYGYYYITSSLGAVVTIDSVKPHAIVIDKNRTPGWDPENPDNPDESGELGKFVASAADSPYDKTSTAAIGDTAYFKINAYAPKYAGDKLVATYKFVDTLGNGFTYNDDLEVTLNGTRKLSKGTDYTVSADGQTITVVVSAGTIADYPTEAHLSITYSATVDKDAAYDNVNMANLSWTVYPNDPGTGKPDIDKDPYDPNDPTDPNNPGKDPSDPNNPGEMKTDTYVFGFNLQKYKESVADGNKLTGAKFKLYNAATGGNEIPVVKVSDGVYRVAEAGETGVEIEAGTAKIFGLDATTYYLEEIVAPDGYNKLTGRVEVTISDEADAHTNGIQNATTNVVNNSGALLPSTGGIGTTIFYVLGGILVIGAGVVLVSKKRMA